MKKKFLSLIFVICLLVLCAFIMTACADNEDKCEHVWSIATQPTAQQTGYATCTKCFDQGGFELPVLNDTNYTVSGTNPDYKTYTYTKGNQTFKFVSSNFETRYEIGSDACIVTGYTGSNSTVVIPDVMMVNISPDQRVYEGEDRPVQFIDSLAFANNTTITSVTLPDDLKAIYGGAFSDCTNLSLVDLPDSLDDIGNNAFANTGLKEVVIPNSVTQIGYNVYGGCNNLEKISLSFDFPYCQFMSFSQLFKDDSNQGAIPTSLKEVVVTGSKNSIGDYLFADCSSIEKIVLNENVTTIAPYAFSNCSSLKEIVLPNSLQTIGDNSFWRCSSLEEIIIPNSVTTIGSNAFDSCSSLKEVVIPNSVTTLRGTFTQCALLEKVVLGSSFDVVGHQAFYGCENLTELVIPSSLTAIDDCAFSGCTSLEKVYYMGTKSQWNSIEISTEQGMYIENNAALVDIEVYSYSETKPTGVDYLNNDGDIKMWHFNDENGIELWQINLTNNVDNKSFAYSHSEVAFSDTYWAMLQEAKTQDMLGMLFDNDQVQIEMVTSSATKAEYETKFAAWYGTTMGTQTVVSFADGKLTITLLGVPGQMDYIEVDGEIYDVAKKEKIFTFNITNNSVYEERADEHSTIKHVYSIVE